MMNQGAAAAATTGTALLLAVFMLPALPVPAQEVKVIREVKHDLSPPRRSTASAAPAVEGTAEPETDEEMPGTGAATLPHADDPVVQRTPGTKLTATLGMN